MTFQFSDLHVQEYHSQGCTVFRRILPSTLVDDLRRVTDRAREIARGRRGPNALRLQPLSEYGLDQKPIDDFRDLSPLREAVARVLTPAHTYGTPDMLGVLLEPGELPCCTPWHRDWDDKKPGVSSQNWDALRSDSNFFNQVNCALFEDDCTWIVPGSHLRHDLPREEELFPNRPVDGPDLEGYGPAEQERICVEYCRIMPGAERLHLDAGDFALYRNTLWHIGTYVPYRRRATLHDAVDTPQFKAWRENINAHDE